MSKEISEESENPEDTALEAATQEAVSEEEASEEEASEEASLEDASSEASSEEEELLIEEDTDNELLSAEDPYSGSCGESATWKYDTKTKVLTISGSGAMDDYEIMNPLMNSGASTTAPWFKHITLFP